MTSQAKKLKKELKRIHAKPYTGKGLKAINNFSGMKNVAPFTSDVKGIQVRTQRNFIGTHPKHGNQFEYGKAMSPVKPLNYLQKKEVEILFDGHARIRSFGNFDFIEY